VPLPAEPEQHGLKRLRVVLGDEGQGAGVAGSAVESAERRDQDQLGARRGAAQGRDVGEVVHARDGQGHDGDGGDRLHDQPAQVAKVRGFAQHQEAASGEQAGDRMAHGRAVVTDGSGRSVPAGHADHGDTTC